MRIGMLVPGRLDSISGGYAYDRETIAGLRALGHSVDVIEFGAPPFPNADLSQAAHIAWASLAPDALPVIDGLGLPAFLDLADQLEARGAIGLIHHPCALEAGHPDDVRDALMEAERRLFPMLRRLVVTSPATQTTLARDFAVDPARLRVVVPGTRPASRSPGSGGPGCAILALGAYIPRKGHDLLLRALARLFDLDWRLTIVGPGAGGALAETLKALAVELKIDHRVTFLGELDSAALDRLWATTDVFALATQYEGYGMAIAEALARGLPVAITNGGAAGALVPPEAGCVCEVGDLVTYSKALRRLIFDVELRAAVSDAAWQVGQRLPDWPAQAAAFAAALEE